MSRYSQTLLIALIAASIASACTHSGRPGADESGPDRLRVGVHLQRPPMAFRSESGLDGLEPELARKAAQQLGRQVRFVVLEGDQGIPALEKGEIDALMGHWRTDRAQSESILLTQPYLRGGERAAIRKEDLHRLGPPGGIHLPGVRIGYTRRSPGEEYARQHLDGGDVEVYGFDSSRAALRSLRAGRVDFVIGEVPGLGWLIEQSGDTGIITLETPLTEEDFSWAVSRDNPELAQALNRILDQWRANDELRRTLDRWVPASRPIPATGSSRQRSPVRGAHRG